MADTANGGTEDVLVKEEEVLKEEELALEGAVERSEGGVAEKIHAVEELVEEGGVGESLNIPDGEGLAAAVKEKEVPVESEAFETAPIPVEDGKGAEILDPVVVEAGEESSGTAYVVAKEWEEPPEVPPAIVEQEEIPESTGNPQNTSSTGGDISERTHCTGDFMEELLRIIRCPPTLLRGTKGQPLEEEELAIKSILDLGKSYVLSVLPLGKQGDLHLPKLKKINRQMIQK